MMSASRRGLSTRRRRSPSLAVDASHVVSRPLRTMPVCPSCGQKNPELGVQCPRCPERYYIDEDADGSDDSYIGRKAADKYVVVSKISTGGMGSVYRALQMPVQREVAFKVLRTDLDDTDELRDRFEREARAISSVEHPNIVTLHDFGFDADNFPYMVMEYVPGEGLAEWVHEHELTLERIVDVLGQMLSGLAAAHREGIVHRDLKPENVIVTDRGPDGEFVKVLDFGIARMLDEQTREGLTAEGDVFGTPHYMSPEQAEGEIGIGPAADVYACGILLYEMLTEDVPFDAPTAMSVLYQQINEDLPPLGPETDYPVSSELLSVVQTATRKSRDDRYGDAGEMLEALESAALDEPETVDRPAGDVPTSEGTRRHGRPAAGSAEPEGPAREPSVRAEASRDRESRREGVEPESEPSSSNGGGRADGDDETGAEPADTGGPNSTLDDELAALRDDLEGVGPFSQGQLLVLAGLVTAVLAAGGTYVALDATGRSGASTPEGTREETATASDDPAGAPSPEDEPTTPDAGEVEDRAGSNPSPDSSATPPESDPADREPASAAESPSSERAEGPRGGSPASEPSGSSPEPTTRPTGEPTAEPIAEPEPAQPESESNPGEGGPTRSDHAGGGEPPDDPESTPGSSGTARDSSPEPVEKFGAPPSSAPSESGSGPEKFGPPE